MWGHLMGQSDNKRLIAKLDVYHEGAFTDMLMLYAYDIEDALLLSGATAPQDYNYRMLLELVQPYVLALQKDKPLELSVKF